MTLTHGWTMEEAIAKGRGEERPFRCTEHNDHTASASVNVIKGVWFCHACHAKGRVEDRKAPAAEDIEAMLEPEEAATTYPMAYLEVFDISYRPDAYWHTRCDPVVTHALGMGQDPFTGAATFPVFTPEGHLAGVGRRFATESGKSYRYPRGWSASTNLGGTMGRITPAPVVCIVEGYADAAAVAETGCLALCQWGAQMHAPQVEMLAKFNPSLVLLGQDMDEAGERGVSMAFAQLRHIAPMRRVRWPRKDPGETPYVQRLRALTRAVSAGGYGEDVLPTWDHTKRAMRTTWAFDLEENLEHYT